MVKERSGGDADDDSAAPLYFDFVDEDEDDPRESSGGDGSDVDADAPGGTGVEESAVAIVDHGAGAVGWWARQSRGRQRLLIGSVVMVSATALAVGGSVMHANQRAADRIVMSALAGAYVPSPDGEGLDLVLTLRDDGPALATLIWVGVDQPGLALGYPPLPLPIKVGHTMGIKLGGRYTCDGASDKADKDAKTVTVMVRSPRGVVSAITLPLPSGAVLPDGWRDDRAAFCNGMALLTQSPVT